VADGERLPEAAEDDFLVGDEALEADGVEGDAAELRATRANEWFFSDSGWTKSRSRAPRIISAVVLAVPLGESTFRLWCISTISACSKKGAARRAKCIINTAPMAKLAARTTPVLRGSGFGFEPAHEFVVQARGADDHARAGS
jgi:hypothetical protein